MIEILFAAVVGALIGQAFFYSAVWLSEQEWMQKIWYFVVDSINAALDAIKWVIGFPAAVVQNYRRQRKLEREMHEALIDETFLDRATRG